MTTDEALSAQLGDLKDAVERQGEHLVLITSLLQKAIARVECAYEASESAREDTRDIKAAVTACTDQVLELTQAVRSRPCMVPAVWEPCVSVSMAANRRGMRVVETTRRGAQPLSPVDESEGP